MRSRPAIRSRIKRPFALLGVLMACSLFFVSQMSFIPQVVAVAICFAMAILFLFYKAKGRFLFAYFLICAFSILYLIGYTAIFYLPSQNYVGQEVSLTAEMMDCKHTNGSSYQYTLRAKKINGKSQMPFSIFLSSDGQLDATYGDCITVDSLYLRSTSNQDFSLSVDDYSRSNGIYLSASLPSNSNVTVSHPSIYSPFSYCKRLRDCVVKVVDTSLQTPYCFLLDGMLFGDKNNLPFYMIKNFRACGISHLLAISGLHITLISSALFFLLSLLHVPRRILPYLGIGLLLGYAAMAGFSPSVLRACIMTGIGLYAPILMRQKDSLNALGLAAFILLLFNPYYAVNVSFLLSFSAVLGLLLLQPRLLSIWEDRRPSKGKTIHSLKENVSLTIAAMVATMPISLLFFGQFSFIAIIVNPIAIPIAEIALIFGLLTAFIGVLIPVIGGFFGLLSGIFCFLLDKVAALFGSLPFASIYLPQKFVLWFLIIGGAFFLLCFVSKERFEMARTCVISLFAICSICCLFNQFVYKDVVNLQVLGNKDGYSVITACGNHAIVIGCGGGSYSGENTYNYLCSMGVKNIDALILPELTKEYARGASFLLEQFPVNSLFVPDSGALYGQVYGAAEKNQIKICSLQNQEVNFNSLDLKIQFQGNDPVFSLSYPNNRIFYAKSVSLLNSMPDDDTPNLLIAKDCSGLNGTSKTNSVLLLMQDDDSIKNAITVSSQSDCFLSLGKRGITTG